MADIDDKFTTTVQVSLARIEERQIALQNDITNFKTSVSTQVEGLKREADHRHANVKMQLDNMVPRREIETMIRENKTYAEAQADDAKQHCDSNRAVVVARVESVAGTVEGMKATLSRLGWAALGLFSTSAVGLITWFVHFVLTGKTF